MFDSKLYKETFSQVQASGETLSEVLNMSKKNKHNGARTARLVLIAAVVHRDAGNGLCLCGIYPV